MNLGHWLLQIGTWGFASAGGPMGEPPDDFDDDEVRVPPKRTWLWVLIGLVLLAGAGIGGYYFYQQQQEIREAEELLNRSGDLPPAERAAALRQVLTSKAHDSFRKDAARQLGEIGDTEAVPLLLAEVTDTGEVSQTAAEALGRIHRQGRLSEDQTTRARDLVHEQLQAAEGFSRTQFAFALALLEDERCIEPLLQGYIENSRSRSIEGLNAQLIARFASPQKMIELTKSDDAAVRMFAAQTLGEQGTDEGVDALIKLLSDANRGVVRSAAESLAKVSPSRAGPELIQLMQKQPSLQQTLVVALRDAVGAPGLQPIYENSEDWDLKLRLIQHVRAPPEKVQSLDVPRGIGDPRGGDMCDHFYKNYEGPQPMKEMGLWCLEELGDRRAAYGLFKIAEEEYSRERDNIIDASIKSIGNLKLPGAQEFLLELLKQGKGRPATILGALGRVGDETVGSKIERFTHCPEANVLSGGACDRETALKVLGRIHWAGAFKLLTDTAERREDDKVATRIESRDIWQEFRLRDRIAAFEGLAHLGDPEAAELLMHTMEDTEDDPQIRFEAARALAYSVNDEVISTILTKIRDTELDMDTRKFYVAALWHRPNREAINSLFEILESSDTPSPLLLTTGFALGEAGEDMVDQARLRRLLESNDSEHLVAASMAILMSGDDESLRLLAQKFRETQGLEMQARDRYAGPQGHPVFLTPAMFDDNRIYRRLRNAELLRDSGEGDHGWAWHHLIDRLLRGTVASPQGMSPYEIRERLAEDVRSKEDPEWRRLAALALLRMGFRGYVLMLAAEEGQGAETARQVLLGG